MLTRHGSALSLPLAQERALLKRYLAIESLRLGDRLRIQWNWPPWADAIDLPPLLLQPLVENAVKHGIAASPEGGHLRIAVARQGVHLFLRVANTGAPWTPKAEGKGLANLRERLVKALDRIKGRLSPSQGRGAPVHGTRYPVQAGSGLLFLDLARTLYFEVQDQIVWAFTGERFRTKWKSLGEVEAFFPEAGLLRIHRHLLLRPEAVLGLRSTGGGTRVLVRLQGGIELEASRGATPALRERLGLI